jgi:hypothetical protein
MAPPFYKLNRRIADSPFGVYWPNSVYKVKYGSNVPMDCYPIHRLSSLARNRSGRLRSPTFLRALAPPARRDVRSLSAASHGERHDAGHFGSAHVESFFVEVETRCTPRTTTRLRYGRMLDRLCRHLVEEGIRTENPVTAMAAFERWPEDEPVPLFLDVDADARLQEWVRPAAADDGRAVSRHRCDRSRAATNALRKPDHRRRAAACRSAEAGCPRIPQGFPAIAALSAWKDALPSTLSTALLFPAPGRAGMVNDVLLGAVVRESLQATGFHAPDMSPRVLRNTYARRQLIAGRSNEDVTRLLGLASQRTVVRLRATIEQSRASQSVELT